MRLSLSLESPSDHPSLPPLLPLASLLHCVLAPCCFPCLAPCLCLVAAGVRPVRKAAVFRLDGEAGRHVADVEQAVVHSARTRTLLLQRDTHRCTPPHASLLVVIVLCGFVVFLLSLFVCGCVSVYMCPCICAHVVSCTLWTALWICVFLSVCLVSFYLGFSILSLSECQVRRRHLARVFLVHQRRSENRTQALPLHHHPLANVREEGSAHVVLFCFVTCLLFTHLASSFRCGHQTYCGLLTASFLTSSITPRLASPRFFSPRLPQLFPANRQLGGDARLDGRLSERHSPLHACRARRLYEGEKRNTQPLTHTH